MPRHIVQMSRRLRRNRIAGLLMACLAFGAQARLTRAESVGPRPPGSGVSAALAAPWWSGFGEPALADLQREVLAHTGAGGTFESKLNALPSRALPPDTQVTAAFVATRILNVRLMVATELLASAAQMRHLVAAGAPTPLRAEALQKIDAQMAQTRAHAEALRQRRDGLIETLAAWCDSTPDTLPEGLHAALVQGRIPSFDADAPRRLSRAVLAARPDVSAQFKRYNAQLHAGAVGEADAPLFGGWIEAPGSSSADAQADRGDESPAQPEAMAMGRVALRAEQEVRANLYEVQQRSEQVAEQVEVLKTRQMDVAATHRRFEAGAGSEAAFLSAYQQWLLDSDRLAVASGDLAQAWIRLEASTSGQALAASISAE